VLAPSEKGKPDELLRQIPLAEMERLCLHEQVQITSQAVCALLRTGIPIHYHDGHGRHLGTTLSAPSEDSRWRLRQYQRTLEPDFSLQLAVLVVQAKIHNQHRLLQKANANRPRGLENELEKVPAFQAQSVRAADLDQLRGVEGAATAHYFRLYGDFLPPEFPFERRSSRPPHNAVNACISFGSALVYQELVAAIHGRGLDPGLGLLHGTENGRWALALDLMEPFRPALMEALTLRLFAHRMLGTEDFEPHESGVYLSKSGRKKFIQEYEQRIQREFLSEHAGHRTTLRQMLGEQVVSYKVALEKPEAFAPFRLN